jgi:serine-type D-Ala-D-Ala carboxypeptidase (penicillin-binding protein 5/6)
MTTTDDSPVTPDPEVVLAEQAGLLARGRRRGGHPHRHSPDRRRRRWPWIVAAAVVLAIGGVMTVAVQRINAPLAAAVPHDPVAAGAVVPGSSPSLPWPAKGQGAVVVPSLGYAAQSGPESPVPIASLTKMTTAVVILRDHPLPAGSDGPAIPVTAADAAEYQAELKADESSVAIQAGETITERQMLEGLLLASANDIAFSLAMWDAGSIPAFAAKMNALATSLGATNTHYVDASGYDPASVSAAADVLKVASVGMAIPTFAEIVALPQASLPLVGTVHNVVTEIGTNGVVGVKSGYTSKAGACLVLAANRVIDGRSLLVIEAVLGQPTPPPTIPTTTTTTTTRPPPTTTTTAPPAAGATPPAAPTTSTTQAPAPTTTTTSIPLDDLPIADPFKYARPVAEGLLAATQAGISRVTVATAGAVTGTVTATWGGVSHSATYVTASDAWLPGWPGQPVRSKTTFGAVAPGSAAGTRIGATIYGIGAQFQVVPLKLDQTVPEPSVWWRLRHGGVTVTTHPAS